MQYCPPGHKNYEVDYDFGFLAVFEGISGHS